jgi:hypothetical protein
LWDRSHREFLNLTEGKRLLKIAWFEGISISSFLEKSFLFLSDIDPYRNCRQYVKPPIQGSFKLLTSASLNSTRPVMYERIG